VDLYWVLYHCLLLVENRACDSVIFTENNMLASLIYQQLLSNVKGLSVFSDHVLVFISQLIIWTSPSCTLYKCTSLAVYRNSKIQLVLGRPLAASANRFVDLFFLQQVGPTLSSFLYWFCRDSLWMISGCTRASVREEWKIQRLKSCISCRPRSV